jgi:hypothetical protein
MTDFQKDRMQYILNKEAEVNEKEKNIKIVTDCTNKNEKYQEAIKNINGIITGLQLPPGSICERINKDGLENIDPNSLAGRAHKIINEMIAQAESSSCPHPVLNNAQVNMSEHNNVLNEIKNEIKNEINNEIPNELIAFIENKQQMKSES